ncbi:hypothetical protein DNTS_020936, partial [Danionella cerebrum]
CHLKKRLTLNGQLLHCSTLTTAVVGRQGESLDAAASTDTAAQNVVGVKVLPVQVGQVLVGGFVATMTVRNDWVEQLLEDFVGLLITSHAADGHDEGVTLSWKQ